MLTLAGFWAGRYGETTGRDRRFAPVIAVGAITLLAGLFGFVLHYLLGEEVVARHALVTALAAGVRAEPRCSRSRSTRSCGAVVGEGARFEQSPEVEVLRDR